MSVLLRLLGQPHIEVDNVRVEVSTTKPVYLLFHLAYRQDWVSREELAALFRPDADESTARHNLRLILSRARKLAWATELEVETQRLRFAVDTDVNRFIFRRNARLQNLELRSLARA